ncbi:hypothetical protein JL721_4663 [Aureococcus anophagefferens]|nr:hypothetical protein JL721_4663 [Aureococcus anophagefferens]
MAALWLEGAPAALDEMAGDPSFVNSAAFCDLSRRIRAMERRASAGATPRDGEAPPILDAAKRAKLMENKTRLLGEIVSTEACGTVGDIFLNMSFALKIYSKYIGDYDTARQTLAEVEANPRFAAFAEASSGRVAQEPEAREPDDHARAASRYELLLRELVKVKRKLGEDEWMDELESCMDAVKEVAEQNNEQIRITESKAKLYDVQKKFSPKLCLVGPNEPTRLLVKDGDAKKVHGRGGAQADKDGLKNAIVVLNSDKSMIILCDTPAEKAQWLAALRATREKARAKLGAAADDGVAMTLWEQDTPQCCVTKAKFTA